MTQDAVDTHSSRQWVAATEAATTECGAALARALPAEPPNRALRVYLCGDLGAGKTTLVRGLLRELGVEGSVRSPTYALYEIYAAGSWRAVHLDLYRLTDPREFANLGLADQDESRALWLVEWPERAGSALPPADLVLRLSALAEEHRIEATATSEIGRAWLARVSNPS